MSMRKWMSLGDKEKDAAKPAAPEQAEEILERHLGMENFGNTCYANSVLQVLYHCRPFREQVELFNRKVHRQSDSTTSTIPATPSIPSTPTIVDDKLLSPKSPSRNGTTKSRSTWGLGHKRISSGGVKEKEGSSSGEQHNDRGRDHSMSEKASEDTKMSSSTSAVPSQERGDVDFGENSTLLTTMRDLFVEISQHPKASGTVAPKDFIGCLRKGGGMFGSSVQQDAHEFLNYLLNTVAEEVENKEMKRREEEDKRHAADLNEEDKANLKPQKRRKAASQDSSPKTWVHSLFEGILTNETRCLTCETVTSRDESFLDLSIDIEQNSSITSCLRQFSRSEMLFQKNKYDCDQCCGLQEAEKRMKIKRLPNVLALHLKRFKYQEDVGRYIKLTYRVVFPFELRLFNTWDGIGNPDRLYELWAVVVHIGVGPHHGHYVALVKSQNRWHLFDDNVVTVIEEADIQKYFGDTAQSGSGYVLFYNAVDMPRPTLQPASPSLEKTVVLPTTVPSVVEEPSLNSPVFPASPSPPPNAFLRHQSKIDAMRPRTAPDKLDKSQDFFDQAPPLPNSPPPQSLPPTPLMSSSICDPPMTTSLSALPPPMTAITPPPDKTEFKGLFGTIGRPPKSPSNSATPLVSTTTGTQKKELQKRESSGWGSALSGGLRRKSMKDVRKKKDKERDKSKDEDKGDIQGTAPPLPQSDKEVLSTTSHSPKPVPSELLPRPPSSTADSPLTSSTGDVSLTVPPFTNTPTTYPPGPTDSDNVSAISSSESTTWRNSHLSVGSNSPFVFVSKQRRESMSRESMSSTEGSTQGNRPSTAGSGVVSAMHSLNSKTSNLFRKKKKDGGLKDKDSKKDRKTRSTSLQFTNNFHATSDFSEAGLDATPTFEEPSPVFSRPIRPSSSSSTPMPGPPALLSDPESLPPSPIDNDFYHALTEPLPLLDTPNMGTVRGSNQETVRVSKLNQRKSTKVDGDEKKPAKEDGRLKEDDIRKTKIEIRETEKERDVPKEEKEKKKGVFRRKLSLGGGKIK